MPSLLKDMAVFLSEIPRSFQTMGAMLPSSCYLGEQLCSHIDTLGRPRTVLEVGPGTGAVTRQLVGKLTSEDTLILCEVNPRFVRLLKQKFKEDSDLARCRAKVIFFEGYVQDLPAEFPELSVDFIVSSLPFANFAPNIVHETFSLYHALMPNGGTVSFYEYIGARFCKQLLAPKVTRQRVKAVSGVVTNWQVKASNEGQLDESVTLLNVPPARAVHLSFGSSPSQSHFVEKVAVGF